MVLEKEVIKPYLYQVPVIAAVKSALAIRDFVLFVMAMGLGKTVTSAFIVEDWLREGKRGLFLCHETYILEQVEQEYRSVLGDDLVYKTFYGSEANGKKDWTADQADILFASFQSLNNWHEKWYLAFDPDHFDFMVVDESHHGQAPSYKEVIDYFQCKKIAMTATPDRMDLKDIREIFGEEVYTINLEDGIVNGWLADIEYHVLSDGINNSKLKKICREVLQEGKRVSIKQLNETIFINDRDKAEKEIISEYSKIKEIAGTKKTLLFCERILHADNLIKHFENGGVMHSKRTYKENDAVFRSFKNGDLQYIASVNKFNEGKHVPGVEVIAALRSTNSLTTFWQQLGRALAKTNGKEKIIYLDFVSNLDRLVMVRDLMLRIKKKKEELVEANSKLKPPLDESIIHVNGEGSSFIFSDEMMDIMKVIEALRKGYYETWQEASAAAIVLGISSEVKYNSLYKKDLRLPSSPYHCYPDFPGWYKFLGKEFYSTWREGSEAAQRLKVSGYNEYKRLCRQDPRLPISPDSYYKDFPDWHIFLGKEKPYLTWQEASSAAQRLGIVLSTQYWSLYKKDPRLPSTPHVFYANFPDWRTFLGNKKPDFYSTWQEASKAAQKLGISNSTQYPSLRQQDSRLPLDPVRSYKDCPGWHEFFGNERPSFYPTWQEAGEAARKLGISNSSQYKSLCKGDVLLPTSPHTYYKDFPDWYEFLGKEKPYSTWQEASKAAQKLGISDCRNYRVSYKKDPRLPSPPERVYKDFPGWNKFLGKE